MVTADVRSPTGPEKALFQICQAKVHAEPPKGVLVASAETTRPHPTLVASADLNEEEADVDPCLLKVMAKSATSPTGNAKAHSHHHSEVHQPARVVDSVKLAHQASVDSPLPGVRVNPRLARDRHVASSRSAHQSSAHLLLPTKIASGGRR